MIFKYFLLSLMFVSLNAQSFYGMVDYEGMFKKENKDKQVKNIIKKAFKEIYFKEALSLLNRRVMFVKDKHIPNFPDFNLVFKYLKSSNNEYAHWLGLTLFTQRLVSISDQQIIKKYGIFFANKIIQKNYCAGYLMKGVFLKKGNYKKNNILEIWKQGIDLKCHGQKRTKFYLKSRYYGELYGQE